MRRLRVISLARGHRDRGAIAIIVMLVAGMGVLLGAAALSIDVGATYAQRRHVQNGADAVALALAGACAKGMTNCTSAYAGSTQAMTELVSGNGPRTALGDESSGPNPGPGYTAGVCFKNFKAPSPTPICNGSTGQFIDCPGLPTASAALPYVEAHLQTSGTNHLLMPFLAQTMGFTGANVQACARAALGTPGFGAMTGVLPITMSYCDWKAAVGADPLLVPPVPGTFQNAPSGPAPGYGGTTANPVGWPAGSAQKYVITAKNDTVTCPTWNGHTAPGGFAWLSQATAASCAADIVDSWVSGDPGNNKKCDPAPYWGQTTGKTVYVPIFDCVSDVKYTTITSSSNCTTSAHGNAATYYHIAGYAAFYLSGWKLSGSDDTGSNNPNNGPINCPGGGSGRCLSGWFTHALIGSLPLQDPTDTTPGFGPTEVLPAG